jgi:hypothetical protein
MLVILVCHVSRGKSLDVFLEFIALLVHWTQYPSVQLLGSVSLVQACWITSCNASTRLGPPFFNSSAAIESAPAALWFFRYFSAISYFLTARQINVNSITSQTDWTCWLLRFGAFVQVFFKMFFRYHKHLVLVKSSPLLARHIATCGSNGRLTSFKCL